VLIRSANNPMMVACWFAILKAGGIVVATMPLLRSKELTTVANCARNFMDGLMGWVVGLSLFKRNLFYYMI